MRSYPRWAQEYNVCIEHIHSAKTLHLDFYHEDGTTTLEPCNPQNHASSVFIGVPSGRNAHQMTVISAEPLDPKRSCEGQHIPDMSGLWITHGSVYQIHEILMGNVAVEERHHEMCLEVRPSERANSATFALSDGEWMVTMAMELESVEGTCRIALTEQGEGGEVYTNYISAAPKMVLDMSH